MLKQFHQRHPIFGFSMIELIIVVAAVSILAMIAVPSYLGQVRKGNRAEAKTALLTGSQAMERCFTSFTSYSNAGCPTSSTLSSLGQNFFTYSIASTSSSYRLVATASSAKNQDKDSNCKTFSVNNLGQKVSTDSGDNTSSNCW